MDQMVFQRNRYGAIEAQDIEVLEIAEQDLADKVTIILHTQTLQYINII